MSQEVGPAVRRRQLSRQLRELRTAAGFTTMDAAAAATGLSRATISRIESAKQVVLPRTVRLLCQIYGIGSPALDQMLRLAEQAMDARDLATEFADVVPDWYERYVGEESDATELLCYAAESVPYLLRTDDYHRATLLASEPDSAPDDVDRAVAFHAVRTERLHGKRPPKLHVVLNEAVVRREVGGPRVLAAQLEYLLTLSERPTITLQVLPFVSGAHPAMTGSFTMLRFPPSTGVSTVFVEVDSYGMYRDHADNFARYNWIFDRLTDLALDPVTSQGLLAGMTERVH